jgi:hypothetical protein
MLTDEVSALAPSGGNTGLADRQGFLPRRHPLLPQPLDPGGIYGNGAVLLAVRSSVLTGIKRPDVCLEVRGLLSRKSEGMKWIQIRPK